VFVVPNLNVFYEEVELIFWDNAQCTPAKVPDAKDSSKLVYPSTFIFNVKSEESKEALTFYSRHHIINVKIRELSDGVAAQAPLIKRVEMGEKICCEPEELSGRPTQYLGSCLGKIDPVTKKLVPTVICDNEDAVYERERSATLQTSLESWQKIVADADETKSNAITNNKSVQGWFDDSNVGQKDMANKELNVGDLSADKDLRADKDGSFKAQLAPNYLVNEAKLLPEGKSLLDVKSEPDGIAKIRSTNRIQFSGASGAYELALDKARASEVTREDCDQKIPLAYGSAATAAAAVATGSTVAVAGAGLFLSPAVVLAAGALVISSAIAGCNYELDVGLDAGDISLGIKAFGTGVSSTFKGGRYISYHVMSAQNLSHKTKFQFYFYRIPCTCCT